MSYTKQQIIDLAVEAGFEGHDRQSGQMSGNDKEDESLYVEEYAVGNAVFALLKKLGIEVLE